MGNSEVRPLVLTVLALVGVIIDRVWPAAWMVTEPAVLVLVALTGSELLAHRDGATRMIGIVLEVLLLALVTWLPFTDGWVFWAVATMIGVAIVALVWVLRPHREALRCPSST